jgi:hypothetical protein
MQFVIGKILGRMLAQLHSQIGFSPVAQASREQKDACKVNPTYA